MQILTRLMSRRGRPVAPPARARQDARAWFTRRAARAARDELAPLLEAATDLDLGDPGAVAELRRRAHETTARLAAAGHLPPSLVVALDDPAVVLPRILAAAWCRVTPAPEAEGPAPGREPAASRTPGVLSRHPTSEGTVVYTRDDLGRLQVWLEPADGPAPLLRPASGAGSAGDVHGADDRADCA